MDFKKELEKMRKGYARKPLKNIDIPCPRWIQNPENHEEGKLFTEKDELIRDGILCYASVVQANQILFCDEPRVDSAANLLYSTDDVICENPQLLKSLSQLLFMYKDRDPEQIPDEWKSIAAAITAEDGDCYTTVSTTVCNQPVQACFNANLITRSLLPKNKLCGNLLPVLAIPGKCVSVLILPEKYWSRNFKKAWVKGLI